MSGRNNLTRIDNQGKEHPYPKRSADWNCLQRLRTHNIHINDVENSNGSNQEGDITFAKKNRMRLGKMMKGKSTKHYSTHLEGEQNKKKKCSNGVD